MQAGTVVCLDVQCERITVDQGIMGGIPCIRGTRIPVATVAAMLADGLTVAEVITNYPQLIEGDIRDVLRYTSAQVDKDIR